MSAGRSADDHQCPRRWRPASDRILAELTRRRKATLETGLRMTWRLPMCPLPPPHGPARDALPPSGGVSRFTARASTRLSCSAVEEASDHARAIQWYDEYLMRAPTGTYASEALGRKMTLTNKLGGTSRARPIAEEYLRRFPAGTYAGPARAIVGVP